MAKHLCPWWLAYAFDNPLRRIFHKPEEMFAPYIREGMTAIDLGCGMGYFSISMARMVGETGKVISVDLQQQMLDTLMQRAKQTGVAGRITPLLCDENNIGNHDEVDFALAFWMAHETPDERLFFTQVQTILKKTGTLLLAEPKLHVTGDNFQKMLNIAQETGLRRIGSPLISLSHAALFEKQ
ncbi:MAG: class I SAM-dependent methyltransferase [Proteobacteria bacterium]|nr:class I SAM-dependent methyltransferase [Pseudomonadota bacterium]MBU1547591.1 class I SAM-dependent methyltransferase [Pseudomonadota bacterium]MBU2618746.1 class I SAM-dependent methyltransferase [Pseudomonadota bacterium]